MGGELVDAVSGADVSGPDWVTRSVELPEQKGGRLTLELTVVTKSSGTYLQSAEAWIDAIRIQKLQCRTEANRDTGRLCQSFQ